MTITTPRLPSEAALNGLERGQPVCTKLAPADGRQQSRRHDRYTADPNDDGENMQNSGECEAIHRSASLTFAAGPA